MSGQGLVESFVQEVEIDKPAEATPSGQRAGCGKLDLAEQQQPVHARHLIAERTASKVGSINPPADPAPPRPSWRGA
jgi:hypothetical protein